MEFCGGLLRLELRSPRKCEPKWRTILHPDDIRIVPSGVSPNSLELTL